MSEEMKSDPIPVGPIDPGDLRDDRDVNTDMFPKDEYYWIKRKINLIGDSR